MKTTIMKTKDGYVAIVDDGETFGRGAERPTIQQATESALKNYRGNHAIYLSDRKKTIKFAIKFFLMVGLGLGLMCVAVVAYLFM